MNVLMLLIIELVLLNLSKPASTVDSINIRICCPYGEIRTDKKPGENITCAKDVSSTAGNMEIEVFDEKNEKTARVKLHEPFSLNVSNSDFMRYKYQARLENFLITTDGQILKENARFDVFCLCELYNSTKIYALVFFDEIDEVAPTRDKLYAAAMIISVPFMAATFLVYIFVPELHNLHGKCLLCYLLCLIIGYSFMAWIKLNGWQHVESICRRFIGLTTYFFLLSAFFWSNVMSFDLHQNLRSTNMFQGCSQQVRFIFYMLYAWGLPLLLTCLTVLLDHVEPWTAELLPGIGTETLFLKRKHGKLSAFLYFYMLICIICILNFMLFILTALKIRVTQRDISRITSQEESARHQSCLNNKRNNWILFVRLFIIMGVSWIIEGVSFPLTDLNNKDTNLLVCLIDIWNLSQGLAVFILFIMKRRVLNLIKKRCDAIRARSRRSNERSSRKTTPSIKLSNLESQSSSSSHKSKDSSHKSKIII